MDVVYKRRGHIWKQDKKESREVILMIHLAFLYWKYILDSRMGRRDHLVLND